MLPAIFIVLAWAAMWGICLCELFYLGEDLTDFCIILSLFLAPVAAVAFGVFAAYVRRHRNRGGKRDGVRKN